MLVQGRLSAPTLERFAWLDLACGRGQIILSLEGGLSCEARAKIDFWGYDLDQQYVRDTQRAGERVGFGSLQVHVGDLSDFDRRLPKRQCFDFVTLTNAVHEIRPVELASVLVDCIVRLADGGTLFIYDMEKIIPPELGALAWTRDEMRRIIDRLLDALGVKGYRPEVGQWTHTTCCGWNVQLHRHHLGISRTTAEDRRGHAIEATRGEIDTLVDEKLDKCRRTLDRLVRCGAETAAEESEKPQLLNDFYSLSRAMEERR